MNPIVWDRKILSNGMRLLLFPRPSGMTAQLSVAVEYGSNFEEEANAGMAHLQEHMTAGGSVNHIELSRGIEKMGGYVDFSTSNEDTMVITDVLPDRVNRTAQILSDLIFDSDFQEEKLVSERKIILHEISEAEDDPWGNADELLRKCLFRNHPVRRPVLGFRRTVSQLSLDLVKENHRANYVPKKSLLILTGNFNNDSVDAVCRSFEKVEKAEAVSMRNPFVDSSEPRKESVKSKAGINQTYLCMGARTVAARHCDTPVLNIIDTLLGAGASSRLFIELREKKALAYTIDSTNEYGSDYGFFHIDCAINSRRLEDAKKLVWNELEKLRGEMVLEGELSKAKDMIIGAILRTVDSPVDFPETIAVMEMQFGNVHAVQDYVDQIKAIRANEIVEVANKYLNEDNFSTAIICPRSELIP